MGNLLVIYNGTMSMIIEALDVPRRRQPCCRHSMPAAAGTISALNGQSSASGDLCGHTAVRTRSCKKKGDRRSCHQNPKDQQISPLFPSIDLLITF